MITGRTPPVHSLLRLGSNQVTIKRPPSDSYVAAAPLPQSSTALVALLERRSLKFIICRSCEALPGRGCLAPSALISRSHNLPKIAGPSQDSKVVVDNPIGVSAVL